MKLEVALQIIKGKDKGYMVRFLRKENKMYTVDTFPDKFAGEELIKTEKEAITLATKFSEETKGVFFNIYVVNYNFQAVNEIVFNHIKKGK